MLVHRLGFCKATLEDRLAEWITEQQDPLLYRKSNEQNAAVGMVLHSVRSSYHDSSVGCVRSFQRD
jgi:hypothetical protein